MCWVPCMTGKGSLVMSVIIQESEALFCVSCVKLYDSKGFSAKTGLWRFCYPENINFMHDRFGTKHFFVIMKLQFRKIKF